MKDASPPPEWLTIGFFGLIGTVVSLLLESVREEPMELGKALLRAFISGILAAGIIAVINTVRPIDPFVGVAMATMVSVLGVQTGEAILKRVLGSPFQNGEGGKK